MTQREDFKGVCNKFKYMKYGFLLVGVICDPKASYEPSLNILVLNKRSEKYLRIQLFSSKIFNDFFLYINLHKIMSPQVVAICDSI